MATIKFNFAKLLLPLVMAVGIFMIVPVAGAATFTVDSTADSVDANPGDGVCADIDSKCTLRAAVMESNALAGADVIDLTQVNNPNDPVVLSIKGVDESYKPATGGGYQAVATHDASKGDLNITDSTTITGAGSGKTVIEWSAADQADGSADRIFHVEAVSQNISVTMSGLTVKNGLTTPVVDVETTADEKIWQFKRHGGGIALGTAADASLFDPASTHGGGGGNGGEGGGHGGGHGGEGGGESGFAIDNVTLSDVDVLDNLSGGDGGGIYSAVPLTISSSVISGNTASSNGGGIYSSAAMTVVDVTIGTMASNAAFSKGNHAENGGGIFDTGLHTSNIRNTTISGNTATGGAGLSSRSATIDNIENSTITGNVARDNAGGIASCGNIYLKNVTLVGNSVVPTSSSEEGGAGAGLYSFGKFGVYRFVNSIIANNTIVATTTTLSNCGRVGGGSLSTSYFITGGHNIEDGDSCGLIAASADLKNTDPILGALADNGGATEAMAIDASSPALDAGDNDKCPNNDQRGSLRPADGDVDGEFVCDIGAFELFVHTADLHINNMVAPDTVYASDSFQFSVEIHNDPTASTTASGVMITTDPLPADFTVTGADVTVGGVTSPCSVAGGVVSCDVGSLAVGAAATAVITGKDAVPGELTVTGRVSDTGPVDPFTGNNMNISHIQVIGNSDIGVTASSNIGSVNRGQDVSLSFTATNHGGDSASNVRVAAFIPVGLSYKSIAIDQGDCSFSTEDNAVTCIINSLASGESVSGTLILTSTAESSVSTATKIAVDADQRDLVPNNDVASVSLSLVNDGGGGNGGCVYRGYGPFDPTLPAILLAGISGLMYRRLRKFSPKPGGLS